MVAGDLFANFPKEVKQLHDAAIEFAKKRLIRSDSIERDRQARFDHEGWLACAEFGLLGMPVPEEYSGTALGLTSLLAVMEGLGYACLDQGLLFSINAHLWTNTIPLLRYGTEQQ